MSRGSDSRRFLSSFCCFIRWYLRYIESSRRRESHEGDHFLVDTLHRRRLNYRNWHFPADAHVRSGWCAYDDANKKNGVQRNVEAGYGLVWRGQEQRRCTLCEVVVGCGGCPGYESREIYLVSWNQYWLIAKERKNYYLKIGCAGNKGTKVSRGRRDSCMSCTAAAPEHVWIVCGVSTNTSPFLIGFTRFQLQTLKLSITCAHTVPLCGMTMLFS